MAAKLARERATDELINNILPNVEFAEDLHFSVICFLCKNILKNPMQISCGHRLCKVCNENLIPINSNGERFCPEHEEIIERAFPDRAALTDIMNLSCFCLARKDGCMWNGLLMDLELHIKDCEFFVQLFCPYSEFQCTFQGSRAALAMHMCNDSIKHDCLLATSLKEMVNRFEENSVALKRIEIETQEIDQNFTNTQNMLSLVRDQINETSKAIDENSTNTVFLREKTSELNEVISMTQQRKLMFEGFYARFQELKNNVDKQVQLIEQERINSENSPNTKRTLLTKANQLEDSNKTHEKQINDFNVKLRIYQCSSNDGNYTWKLDNLRKRMAEATSVSELFTPPLYTSPFGYKYSAKVMLNGNKEKDVASYLAFYVVIMQGDFDEILKFPFPYPVKITLVHNDSKKSIEKTLYPEPAKEHFQKPWKSMNPSIGFAKFISHEKLLKGGFIKDDAIYFQINVLKEKQVKEPNI